MKNILYTRDFKENIKEDVNVILSPQYYWIKKIDIPVKNRREAKKIAKNIFDLKQDEYYFDAVKIGNDYYAVAIRKDLNINIDKKYIKSVRIAQTELDEFECINLPNGFSLKKVEGMFFCFPGHSDNGVCLYNVLEKISLSDYTFNIFNTLNIDVKNFIKIMTVLIFIFISLIIRNVTYFTENQKILKKFEYLKSYGLPLNNYQLNAVLKDYETKYNKIINTKKVLSYINRIPLRPGEYIKEFVLDKNKITLTIHTNKKRDDFLSHKFKIIKSSFDKSHHIYKVVLDVK